MAICQWQGSDCDGDEVVGLAKRWTWHDRYVEVPACARCLERERQREEDGPSDDQVYNGPGIEGGIRYTTPVEKLR